MSSIELPTYPYVYRQKRTDIQSTFNVKLSPIVDAYMNTKLNPNITEYQTRYESVLDNIHGVQSKLFELKNDITNELGTISDRNQKYVDAIDEQELIEYELMKDAAENLNQIPQVGKDIMIAQSYFERLTEIKYPDVSIDELFEAWKNVIKRVKQFEQHQISRSELSVREYMTIILRKLNEKDLLEFSTFFNSDKDPIPKLVVCFLAILELTKEGLIKINQQSSSSAIYLQLGDS